VSDGYCRQYVEKAEIQLNEVFIAFVADLVLRGLSAAASGTVAEGTLPGTVSVLKTK
jgi:hypothetical protein